MRLPLFAALLICLGSATAARADLAVAVHPSPMDLNGGNGGSMHVTAVVRKDELGQSGAGLIRATRNNHGEIADQKALIRFNVTGITTTTTETGRVDHELHCESVSTKVTGTNRKVKSVSVLLGDLSMFFPDLWEISVAVEWDAPTAGQHPSWTNTFSGTHLVTDSLAE